MAASKPRLKFPEQASAGEIIEIKALITHVMETGNRKDADGNRIPRDIIHTFTAHYDDQLIFKAEFGPGISANPFISFFLKVPGPGELWVSWKDDAGGETIERYPLNVV
ncbi:MAG: thiosulfate oxidation carrier complex protein SoxZ [Hyphomicrobium zavarzinii]|jgi:sulfur-oxidizing protein SoxZ|uniref:thiosulfate oxidation carrier complex protein SoxZ n=1 Tax=Hyphomicrobium TaxID=81 RepID=UPI00037DD317|nr:MULTISPECIES: thiosulfate oxidation carrier complex protein SoxZ [Hyphomicrobium]MBL8845229.1 thiosulfate oxidation carrier complex protein SoxZ [Hyphomicrobium zavarzinii]WBT36541.1 thiosulfate oxidation carrier complex protein SoxZ [Hyphomicrobium sp. DMF-1]HML44334.1 thiosulfate oxidation carrier complex protein SoxZ [Hyphomicrobium zavarzinii]